MASEQSRKAIETAQAYDRLAQRKDRDLYPELRLAAFECRKAARQEVLTDP